MGFLEATKDILERQKAHMRRIVAVSSTNYKDWLEECIEATGEPPTKEEIAWYRKTFSWEQNYPLPKNLFDKRPCPHCGSLMTKVVGDGHAVSVICADCKRSPVEK